MTPLAAISSRRSVLDSLSSIAPTAVATAIELRVLRADRFTVRLVPRRSLWVRYL